MSLLSTELACTSAPDQVLHLFFQDGQNILEARSPDGGSVWTTQDTIIANDGAYTGSAMTCYYVDKDANVDNQPTIHLLYMNKDNQMMEKIKRMKGDNPVWENFNLPDEVKKGPEQNSRLTSGAWNNTQGGWNPNGSQWAYFSSVQDGKMAITEVRRTPKNPWYSETVLPKNWGDALPGTALACTLTSGNIKVFFQHHDYSICLYEHDNGTWYSRGVYIEKDKVQPTTPLACTRTSDNKVHLFYAGMGGSIMHVTDGKNSEELVKFYPGSKLGATSVDNKITMFYRNLNPVGEVGTLENDSGSWKHGSTVIRA